MSLITPHQLDLYSANMTELYSALEGAIIDKLIKRLMNGKTDILDWQLKALQDLHLYNDEVVKLLSQVTKIAQPEIERMFEESGKKIIQSVDGQLPYNALPMPSDLDNVMRGYYEQCWSGLDNYVNQTLVSTNYGYGGTATKLYTDVLNRTQAVYNTGIYTLDEAMERSIMQQAQQGIRSTYIDKGGHTWSLERYTRTVLKSTLHNTYNKLRTDRMGEYGVYTVTVTSHMGAREACSRIQGNVVDLRYNVPADSEYRSIYDPYWQADYGEPGGHRGVNCQHQHIPFIPGVNTNNQPHYDEKENAEVANLRTKQRQLERTIVKYKKNAMVADKLGDADGTKKWNQLVANNQKAMRKLVASNDYLSRNYQHEKVYTPLETLVRDFRYDK